MQNSPEDFRCQCSQGPSRGGCPDPPPGMARRGGHRQSDLGLFPTWLVVLTAGVKLPRPQAAYPGAQGAEAEWRAQS